MITNHPQNLHVFRITFQPYTNTKPCRTKIYSERFKQGIVVSNEAEKFEQCAESYERAVVELRERGFNIVAVGEGTGCMYVMSDDFKPLK